MAERMRFSSGDGESQASGAAANLHFRSPIAPARSQLCKQTAMQAVLRRVRFREDQPLSSASTNGGSQS